MEGQYSRGFSEFRTTSILIEAETVSRSGESYVNQAFGFPLRITFIVGNVSRLTWTFFPPKCAVTWTFFPKCAVSSQFCELGPRFSCKVSVAFSLNG